MHEERPAPTADSDLAAMRDLRALLGLHRGAHAESVVRAVQVLVERRLGTVLREAHAVARSKGWHDGADWSDPQRQLAGLMLITTEVAEAAECVRVGHLTAMRGANGKPEGLPSELADIVIRLGDYAGAMGIDLEAAVIAKDRFNRTRPARHGGKLA